MTACLQPKVHGPELCRHEIGERREESRRPYKLFSVEYLFNPQIYKETMVEYIHHQ